MPPRPQVSNRETIRTIYTNIVQKPKLEGLQWLRENGWSPLIIREDRQRNEYGNPRKEEKRVRLEIDKGIIVGFAMG